MMKLMREQRLAEITNLRVNLGQEEVKEGLVPKVHTVGPMETRGCKLWMRGCWHPKLVTFGNKVEIATICTGQPLILLAKDPLAVGIQLECKLLRSLKRVSKWEILSTMRKVEATKASERERRLMETTQVMLPAPQTPKTDTHQVTWAAEKRRSLLVQWATRAWSAPRARRQWPWIIEG